jgi:hypothetical protein
MATMENDVEQKFRPPELPLHRRERHDQRLFFALFASLIKYSVGQRQYRLVTIKSR